MVQPKIPQLRLYDSKAIFPLESRTPDTYLENFDVKGNSILSSVFVKDMDAGATLEVKYYDKTTGDQVERYDLNNHGTINTAEGPFPKTFRIIVTRIHHNLFCEVTLSGGNANFSVYTSAIADFPQQPSLNEGETVDLVGHAGNPFVLYDETEGKWYFARGDNGILLVDFAEGGLNIFNGTPKQSSSADGLQSTPGSEQTLITATVPTGKIWNLYRVVVSCRGVGTFKIFNGASRIGSARTGPSSVNTAFDWKPQSDPIVASSLITVKYTQAFGPAMDVESYLFYTEQDAT